FWNGSAWEIFRPYSSNAFAWLDTHNLYNTVGAVYVYAGVRNLGDTGGDEANSSYISNQITHHVDVSTNFDTRLNATEYLDALQENVSGQTVDAHTGATIAPLGHNPYWISTYITYDSQGNNPACAGGRGRVIYSWQSAIADGIYGYQNVEENDFVQLGFEYYCGGNFEFFVALTSAPMTCYAGSAPTIFGMTQSQVNALVTYDSGTQTYTIRATSAADKQNYPDVPGNILNNAGQFYKGCTLPLPAQGTVVNFHMHAIGYQFQLNENSVTPATIPENPTHAGMEASDLHVVTEINGLQTSG